MEVMLGILENFSNFAYDFGGDVRFFGADVSGAYAVCEIGINQALL